MRRLALASVLIAALVVPSLSLVMVNDPFGLFFVITSDSARHLYVEVSGAGGATIQSPSIYEYDIGAGEVFGGRRIEASGPGSVRVRVWAGETEPVADKTFPLPAYRYYVPLL